MTSLKHSYTRKCGPLKNVAFKVLTDVFHWTSFGGQILTSGELRLGLKQAQERTNINDVKRMLIGLPLAEWDLTFSLKIYVYRKLYKITDIEKIMWEQSKQLDKTLHWRRVRGIIRRKMRYSFTIYCECRFTKTKRRLKLRPA